MTAPTTKPDRQHGCLCVFTRDGNTYVGCQLDRCLCPVHHKAVR